ncbi:MAG TPA: VOC family protein [Nitrososphaerales archaeon]|nr:VOC family protein [Nitrososphaerales archaeon]
MSGETEVPKTKKSSRKKSKAVTPIPKGFHSLTPYLTVINGSEAIEFYKRAFGAKEMLRHATPDGKILNAQLKIGDSMLLLSDEFPGSDVRSPLTAGTSTVTIHVYTKDVDKLWEQAIAAGARVIMPLNNQFWGERYGQLADPFGHRWSLSQQVKMSKEEMRALEKASMEMFSQGEHPGKQQESPPVGVG